MHRGAMSPSPAGSFFVMPLNAHTWIVGHARALIPGAILRTKRAALDYASALAKAAGWKKVRVVVRRQPHARAPELQH